MAESQEGKGSAFTVKIPMGKSHLPGSRIVSNEENKTHQSTLSTIFLKEIESLTGTETQTANDLNTGAGIEEKTDGITRKPKVLIVDDNLDMREYMSRLLSKKYEVITAINGKSALDSMAENQPDLIISYRHCA